MKNKIITLSCFLVFVLLCSGCVESEELAGNTYEGPDGDIIRFFEDGKMHYTNSRGTGATGTYTIEDGRVYFNAVRWTWDADIQANGLHNDGDIYVLVEQ